MQKHTLVAVSMAALIAAVIAWNSLGAEALPIIDEAAATPLAEKRVAAEGKPVIVPSIRLWPHPQVPGSSAGGLLYRLDGGRHGLPSTSRGPEATNTPASPLPAPTNTPAAPVGDAGATLERLPSARAATGIENASPSNAPAEELLPETEVRAKQDLQRADVLRQAGARFQFLDGRPRTTVNVSPGGTSEETCVNVILNPELDVVEFGDGTGSIEYWAILFPQVCYDSREGFFWSPSHALTMSDGACSDSPDDGLVDDEDYDAFGQGFWAPANLSSVRVSYRRLYADLDDYDWAYSSLWTLDGEGYLNQQIDAYSIGQSPDGWSLRAWELDSGGLAQASGQPLALVFYFWGDLLPPYEFVWLDGVQVELCYQPGQYGVYLPLLAKQPSTPSQPTCSPREPDSVNQPGSTTVNVTCGGAFSPVDQKDYYRLDLQGARKVRLGLFNVPPGTNWDALIWEDKGGGQYDLACQIGDPGDQDRWKDCPNADGYPNKLDPSKNYFVLVSRGDNQTGGSYNMRVEVDSP